MLYIDLNKFKQINDEFGHDEGDKALAVFANILKNTVRGSDLITRLGGDEFAILLTDATKRLAEEVVKKLLHAKRNTTQMQIPVITFIFHMELFNLILINTLPLKRF